MSNTKETKTRIETLIKKTKKSGFNVPENNILHWALDKLPMEITSTWTGEEHYLIIKKIYKGSWEAHNCEESWEISYDTGGGGYHQDATTESKFLLEAALEMLIELAKDKQMMTDKDWEKIITP